MPVIRIPRTKTYYKVAERYYWSGLYDDVVRLVSVIILEIIFKINCVTAMPIYLLLVCLLSYLQVTVRNASVQIPESSTRSSQSCIPYKYSLLGIIQALI